MADDLADRTFRFATRVVRLIVASDVMPAKRIADLLRESDELVAILTTIVKKAKRPV